MNNFNVEGEGIMTTNANRLHQVEGLLDAIIKSTTTHQIRAKAIDALAHVIKVRETLELHAEYTDGI